MNALPDAPFPPVRWRYIALFLVAAASLLFLRRPDALLNPQLWAEDAIVFHAHANESGIASLVRPNAGYHHLAPRIVAYVASLLDPLHTPAIYNGAAAMLSLAIAAAILRARWPGGPPVAWLAAASFVLVPHYSHEIYLNLTNVQWMLVNYLVLVLICAPPVGRLATTLTTGAVIIAGLTSPSSAALVPLAAWRAWRSPTNPGRLVFSTLALTGLIQAITTLRAGQVTLPGTAGAHLASGPVAWLEIFGYRVALETWLPPAAWPAHGHALAGALLTIGLLAVALWRGPDREPRRILVTSFALFAIISALRIRPYIAELSDAGWGDRYFVPLRIWLMWAVALTLPLLAGRWRLLPWLALVALAIAAIPRYQGPIWTDKHWAHYVPALRAGTPVAIPINPSWIYYYPGHPRP